MKTWVSLTAKILAKRSFIDYCGLFILVIGLFFSVMFFLAVNFELNPTVWFTAAYYSQFIPFYIAATLFLTGAFILSRYSRVNIYLALFGHATSEEVLFSWMGLTSTPLPLYAIFILFPLSLVTLYMAYANTLRQKTISVGEAVFGVVFSTAFILLPRYL